MTFNVLKLKELIDNTENLKDSIYMPYILSNNAEVFEDEDEIREALQEYVNSEEFTYYDDAIEYLSKNDASLQESIELAQDRGYDISNLTSDTLASLHYKNALSEELGSLDLSECFEDVA